MKITFLGTGTSQGVPAIGCECAVCQSNDTKDRRLRSSVLVETNNKTILIDAGMDFRQQMLNANVKNVDAILLTHHHKDHIGGLDDLRAFNYIHNKSIDIFGDKLTLDTVKREFSYCFKKTDYIGAAKMTLNEIENKSFIVAGINILPIKVKHHNIYIFGYRINNFTYITDANFISETEKDKIRGSKIFVLNALRHHSHPSHFVLEQSLEIMNDIKPEMGLFTHASHHIGFHKDLKNILPNFVQYAYDGLQIII